MVKRETSDILVIGIGNTFRRDDGAGVEVLRRLEQCNPSGVQINEQSGEGAALMSAWQDFSSVILVDAVSSGSPPGTIHLLNPIEREIPSEFFHYSTHAFSVAEAVEMARALGRLPERIWIYGIEGTEFGAGEGFSPPVEDSIGQVVDLIREFIDQLNAEIPAKEEYADA